MSDKIRQAMLDCSPGCRVNILKSTMHVNLCWIAGSKMHTERIRKDKCAIGSVEFDSALESATRHLKG